MPKIKKADQDAAHEFLCELRTRISTQPLPYQYGVEGRALESLWEIFGHARSAMKNYPGCTQFAKRTTTMLNIDLRPVTAKWHRAQKDGRLNSRDGANEFREDLAKLQVTLQAFASELHEMAYGVPYKDQLTPPAISEDKISACFQDLPFGISKPTLIPDGVVNSINKKEAQDIALRRRNYKLEDNNKNAVGLGLSGGGIRSATFCLGVTQVLADRDLLKHVDFLSTVSGGGFVGAFITRRVDRKEAYPDIAAPHGPDPASIRYLRQHAKYLSASDLKERWAMVTATFAGMILNWTAPLFVIALVALLAREFAPLVDNPWVGILMVFTALTIASVLVYAIGLRFAALWTGRLLAATTALTLLAAFLWSLTVVYQFIVTHQITLNWRWTGLIAALVTIFPAVVRFIPILSKPAIRRTTLKVVLTLAGAIIPLGAIGLLFCFYYLGGLPVDEAALAWSPLRYTSGFVVLATLSLLFGVIALFLLNINLTAPHRLYRDLLNRAFVQRNPNDVDPVPLQSINSNAFAPYHLINAAVNLPSSTSNALRERKSDFFFFSKHWCGAPSVGYMETSRWHAGRASVDLGTAIAVSGAAASSYMGLGSISTLSALLTFLNIRLGYWIKRPNTKGFATPGFTCLLREMTGLGMSEGRPWINLSDGGHIENMGIYELLRRRCKFIISIDGEADPQSTFHGHLTLVRHAQIDFGIRIEPDLTQLRPDLASKFSQAHAMMCKIHYPAVGGQPAGVGLILYMKLSVTGNERELIKRYRALHPDFPHQTTLDQFFDEEQFEAYRQLGVHVAEGLFARALVGENNKPGSIAAWFKDLASNMLDPEWT